MRVVSWNVNGVRAAAKKGLSAWIAREQPAILGLQETRATLAQYPPEVRSPPGYHGAFAVAERGGYSGVALYGQEPPAEVVTSLGVPAFDAEGRFVMGRWGELTVASVYFPNGSGKDRDNSRIPFKLDFYACVLELLQPRLERGEQVLVMGDFNTAFAPVDLARPRENVENSGFRSEEREALGAWFARGWVDTFRHAHPEATGRYSWWSQRQGARGRNVGWRIDYVLASPAAHSRVQEAFIQDDVLGSDHCPVGVELGP